MLLTEDELRAARDALPAWTFHAVRIERSFRFTDFSEAFAFMTRVALAAEKADHHPDWSNVWNRVDVALSTHSAGGLTALDLEMAQTMDRLACPSA